MRLDAVVTGEEVHRDARALRSARALAPRILELAPNAECFVEVGEPPCFAGQMLERLGRETTCITPTRRTADPAQMFWSERHLEFEFERPFGRMRRFDVCVALTAARLVTPAQAPYLVANLASLSDLIVFSCAPLDGQARDTWLGEWVRLFEQVGLEFVDALRAPLWGHPSIDPLLLESLCVFASPERIATIPRLQAHAAPLDLVHPRTLAGVGEIAILRATKDALEQQVQQRVQTEQRLVQALEDERRSTAKAWERHNVVYEGYLQHERALADTREKAQRELREQRAQAQRELAEQREQAQRELEEQRAQAQRELDALQQALERKLAELREENLALQPVIEERSQAVALCRRLERERAREAQIGEETRREAAALQSEIESLRSELQALRASTSWRITAPVRRLGQFLGRR